MAPLTSLPSMIKGGKTAPNTFPKVPAEPLVGQQQLARAPSGGAEKLGGLHQTKAPAVVTKTRAGDGVKGAGGKGNGGGGKKGAGNPAKLPFKINNPIQAGRALASAEYGPTIHQDRGEIGNNNRQGAAAQRLTAQLFERLGHFTQKSNRDERSISTQLAAQLAGLGGNLGQLDANISGGATRDFGRYTPQANERGVTVAGSGPTLAGHPGFSALHQQLALNGNLNAQDASAYQGSGALQGANYRGLAASNLGTYALSGQQEIGNIGQASRLADQPIIQQIAADRAKEGALAAADAVKLKQQAITNRLTREGLGLKNKALNVDAQGNADRVKIAGIDAALKKSEFNAEEKLNWAKLTEQQRHDLADEANSKAAVNQRAAAAAHSSGSSNSGVKPLTTNENNTELTLLGSAVAAIRSNVGPHTSVATVVNHLQAGAVPHIPKVNNAVALAAAELYSYGHITPKTLAALHAMGMHNITFNGAPIKVGPVPRGFTG